MEALVNTAVWRGRRVLITGHTGFKGGWLALWLHTMGAEITGLALPPDQPSLFSGLRLDELVTHVPGDIRDSAVVCRAIERARPEVVFHLAAQPLVRLSYDEPVETYATNVMGTVHVLDAVRRVGGVRGVVCVTSDKCYENREWDWPYREVDPMGGHDPYSSSKGCAELVIAAWRRSFFADSGPLLASVRAGNVIGGGDWARDRLIPDLVRAFVGGEAPLIRSPDAVRPWQHVLEALGGYLMIAERLLDADRRFADAWNFGPIDEDARPVGWIVERMRAAWCDGTHGAQIDITKGTARHEAGLLRLDSSRARTVLGWRPSLRLDRAIDWIVDWHKRIEAGADPRAVTLEQITHYAKLASSPCAAFTA